MTKAREATFDDAAATPAGAPTIIVCDWIPPAFGAVGQYMMRRARIAAEAGGDVTLVGLGATDDVATTAVGKGSLTIVRLAALAADKKASLWRRAAWAAGKNVRLIRAARRVMREKHRGNWHVVVTGSPPFLSYLVLLLNWLVWRERVTYRITDFYPETAIASGRADWLRLAGPPVRFLRRRAAGIEALGEDQARRLAQSGVPDDRITIVRDVSPVDGWAVAPAERPFDAEKVTLLYSGNLGIAHDIQTFGAAYEAHIRRGSDRVRLWLNATGAQVDRLRAFCEGRGLPLVATPPVPLAELASVLLAADAHLVLLRREFWGYVLPSKIYACIESGRPIVYVGPTESDVHLLSSRRASPYFHVEPGDVDAAFAVFEQLADAVAARRSPNGGTPSEGDG
ncbi:MAG: hypothetical protein KIS68_04805 [Bauldia sp.]|nr:hypothetical protein [Bauldia sp.]